MTIYVDQPISSGHCKMWADMPEEMHAAAKRARIDEKWFTGCYNVTFPHYVVNPTRRKTLIKHGAKSVGRDGAWRWQTLDWYRNGYPARHEIACERIRKHGYRNDLFGPLV
jgi:hypothetical protein